MTFPLEKQACETVSKVSQARPGRAIALYGKFPYYRMNLFQTGMRDGRKLALLSLFSENAGLSVR